MDIFNTFNFSTLIGFSHKKDKAPGFGTARMMGGLLPGACSEAMIHCCSMICPRGWFVNCSTGKMTLSCKELHLTTELQCAYNTTMVLERPVRAQRELEWKVPYQKTLVTGPSLLRYQVRGSLFFPLQIVIHADQSLYICTGFRVVRKRIFIRVKQFPKHFSKLLGIHLVLWKGNEQSIHTRWISVLLPP